MICNLFTYQPGRHASCGQRMTWHHQTSSAHHAGKVQVGQAQWQQAPHQAQQVVGECSLGWHNTPAKTQGNKHCMSGERSVCRHAVSATHAARVHPSTPFCCSDPFIIIALSQIMFQLIVGWCTYRRHGHPEQMHASMLRTISGIPAHTDKYSHSCWSSFTNLLQLMGRPVHLSCNPVTYQVGSTP